MEAVAKHDFKATAEDELSFTKDCKLVIINTEEDQNWFKAFYNGREGLVPNNYIEFKPNKWFCGKMRRADAEQTLLENTRQGSYKHPDGAFLVRYSESSPGEFSMSVNWYQGGIKRQEAEQRLLQKHGPRYAHEDGAFLVRRCESQPSEFSLSVKFRDAVQHFKILKDNQGKYFLWVTKFDSINELIDFHRNVSVNRQQTIYLKDMTGMKKVQAQYDFAPQEEGELKLSRGDVLQVIGELDSHWWKGKNATTNEEGVFPANYKKVQAQYDFELQEDGELKLCRGDVLHLTGELDKHWWKGKNATTNEEGVLPANYVKKV